MAEQLQGVWQDMQDNRDWEIRRAFRELQQRWSGIFDQEALRWHWAGKAYEYRQEPGAWTGHHAVVEKPLPEKVQDMQQALVDMREATDTRLPWEAYAGQGSHMSGPPPEKMTHDFGFLPGTPDYVAWIVRTAIRNGYEEGRPLRANEIEQLRQEVWAQEIGGQHPHGESLGEAVLEQSRQLSDARQEQEQLTAGE